MPHAPTSLRATQHLDLLGHDAMAGLTGKPTGLTPVHQQVLAAALCQAGNLPDIERHFDEQILDVAAHRYPRMGLRRILDEAAFHNGFEDARIGCDLPRTLRAGFSTTALSGILSNVASKFLLAGFDSVESAWSEIAARRTVPNFKPVMSYRLTGNATYEKIPPGGEIKHGSLGDEAFSNQVDTYGRMFTISRVDIINDDLDALTTVPKKLGRGAALTINDVFWTTFLDHAAFFATANGNLLSGADTALSIDGLTKAETAFLEKTDDNGKPLGVAPRILLVPTPLGVPASQLMTSLEIRQTIADTSYPTSNPHTGKFRVVRSAYLSSPQLAGSSSTAWYLLADPNDLPVIEVAFLRGQDRPTIESAEADFSVLGIQMRGYHDWGVSLQDHRGGVKMAGV